MGAGWEDVPGGRQQALLYLGLQKTETRNICVAGREEREPENQSPVAEAYRQQEQGKGIERQGQLDLHAIVAGQQVI